MSLVKFYIVTNTSYLGMLEYNLSDRSTKRLISSLHFICGAQDGVLQYLEELVSLAELSSRSDD